MFTRTNASLKLHVSTLFLTTIFIFLYLLLPLSGGNPFLVRYVCGYLNIGHNMYVNDLIYIGYIIIPHT